MNRKKYLLFLSKLIHLFEILISIMLIIAILISIPDIIHYYIDILGSSKEVSIKLFNDLLAHIMMLVIAMEFILLLVTQTDSTIVYLITLVISRKLLIQSQSMTDILIGVIAITILFITRKFLLKSSTVEYLNQDSNKIFSAVSKIEEINMLYNLQIDDKGFHTLGGLVSNLFENEARDLKEDELIEDDKYIYTIIKINGGLIEEVAVSSKD
ncbi:transporter associated domain-containing protein [Peptoniphilus obesi]|uniref:transporter associated domain-containing protein n=1 Tax=Peptoniphilus obesi TaxID=1472765 RepID=UPI0004B122C7|nr:transporter associated domain-containing protein [Peptoniphilus obesi]